MSKFSNTFENLYKEIENLYSPRSKAAHISYTPKNNTSEKINLLTKTIKRQTLQQRINNRLNKLMKTKSKTSTNFDNLFTNNTNTTNTNVSSSISPNNYLYRNNYNQNPYKPSPFFIPNTNSSNNTNNLIHENLKSLLIKEKEKNRKYKNEISKLYNRIDELENIIKNDNSLEYLLLENKKLNEFKENVFILSKEYTEINENILNSLNLIDQMFCKLNENKFNFNMKIKMDFIENVKNNFQDVVCSMINVIKNNQDEYNYLLSNKDQFINELIMYNQYLKNKVELMNKKGENNVNNNIFREVNCNKERNKVKGIEVDKDLKEFKGGFKYGDDDNKKNIVINNGEMDDWEKEDENFDKILDDINNSNSVNNARNDLNYYTWNCNSGFKSNKKYNNYNCNNDKINNNNNNNAVNLMDFLNEGN